MEQANRTTGGQYSGVQAWSRGELFPAVIYREEVYARPATFEEWQEVNSPLSRCEYGRALYAAYLRNFYGLPLNLRRQTVHWRVALGGYSSPAFDDYDAAERFARWVLALYRGPRL